MRFMEDPAACDPVASLGFDVLAGVPSAEDLAPVLAKRKVAIKNVLLDQVLAGHTDAQRKCLDSSKLAPGLWSNVGSDMLFTSCWRTQAQACMQLTDCTAEQSSCVESQSLLSCDLMLARPRRASAPAWETGWRMRSYTTCARLRIMHAVQSMWHAMNPSRPARMQVSF